MTNNEERFDEIKGSSNQGSGVAVKVLLGAALAIALGGWWYQSTQVASVRQDLAQTQQKMDTIQSQLQASVSVAKTEVNETISRMNEEVEKARKESVASARQAQLTAKQQAGHVMTTLTAKNEELSQQVEKLKTDNDQKVSEIGETLTGIKGDVGTVKTDVASTKTELTGAIADLKRMTGDMGVMSGLIATNSTELAELRKLGEKDYFEFTLPKTAGLQKVGDIQLALKKADVKRNRFTLDVLADDKRVEKKDKGMNEPLQFYTGNARLPYEVVVNQISKDKVVGYLAIPKVKVMAKR
jgi:hypothetical protein